jgi:hypothetical protein
MTGLAALIALIILVRAFSHGKWNRPLCLSSGA